MGEEQAIRTKLFRSRHMQFVANFVFISICESNQFYSGVPLKISDQCVNKLYSFVILYDKFTALHHNTFHVSQLGMYFGIFINSHLSIAPVPQYNN